MTHTELLIDELQVEYQEKQPLYEKLCSEIMTQLNELIYDAEVTTAFPIESRVKSWNSIYEKCERNNLNPNDLGEIPDIAGIRIILLFKRDLDKIYEIIENNFNIIKKEDTQKRLESDQFGYGSIHYELAPHESWLHVPTLRRLQGLQCEVQVRTASQHIWASSSHILQYKQESDVPHPIRRSINRVAALLETVDLEFERVLDERESYIEQIENIDESETLNSDTLRRVLDKTLPEANKSSENYAIILQELRALNISTIKELEDIIRRNWNEVREYEEMIVTSRGTSVQIDDRTYSKSKDEMRKGVFFTHTGLIREILRHEFGENYYNAMRDNSELP